VVHRLTLVQLGCAVFLFKVARLVTKMRREQSLLFPNYFFEHAEPRLLRVLESEKSFGVHDEEGTFRALALECARVIGSREDILLAKETADTCD